MAPPDSEFAHHELRAQLLQSKELGFLGPGSVDAHLDHASVFVAALASLSLPPDAMVIDLGSGGGLPGLVMAYAATTRLILLDSNHRRTAFLTEAITALGREDRVTVVTGRAEELAHEPHLRGCADVVVARSFGRPAVTAECAVGFLKLSGWLVVSEPPGDPDRWPLEGLEPLGLVPVSRYGDAPALQLLQARRACPDGFPRRVGVPTKRPLF